MTQIGKFIPSQKRPGELGIHSMDHFVLAVPDMEKARHFYNNFGLRTVEEGGKLSLYVNADPHRIGQIVEGPKKQLAYISFGLFEEDHAAFCARLQTNGIKRLDPPPGLQSDGVWFHDNDGNLIEAAVAGKTSPNEKATVSLHSVGPGERGQVERSHAPKITPRRFSHLLMFTPDVLKSVEFYSRILGLRLSDRSGDIIAFMHGIHGSDHHMMAFAKSNAPGHHHFSWDVGSIQDIGLGAKQMLEAGYERGWGLGRHVLGSNYFHYVRDPWGSYSEYSCDIDYVPFDHDWQTIDCAEADSLYVWGPNLPEDFVHNYEAES